jgi:hypothetical protein
MAERSGPLNARTEMATAVPAMMLLYNNVAELRQKGGLKTTHSINLGNGHSRKNPSETWPRFRVKAGPSPLRTNL